MNFVKRWIRRQVIAQRIIYWKDLYWASIRFYHRYEHTESVRRKMSNDITAYKSCIRRMRKLLN